MRILGIDPGIALVGYGIIEAEGSKMKMLEYGVIKTSKNSSTPTRLKYIQDELIGIIEEYGPEEVAIEELFINKNIKTAIKVGQARGCEILTCVNKGLEVYEYTPLQIKNALTGHGRAEKHQVQEMVKLMLNLDDIPRPDDAADALALAICHSFSSKFKNEFLME